MKKRTRIIVGIIFSSLALISVLYFLPRESELYLESDISDLQNSLLPISITSSIVLAFIIVFDKSEFNDGKWSKAMYIGYIGIMSYLVFGLNSNLITNIALRLNRVTENQTVIENFIVTNNYHISNGKRDTIPWINHSENKHIIHGRISNRNYEDGVDGIIMNDIDYEKIAKIEPKIEFNFKLKKGLFGILYEPKLSE